MFSWETLIHHLQQKQPKLEPCSSPNQKSLLNDIPNEGPMIYIDLGKLSYFTNLNLAAIKGDHFPY
jgi:hypothetical protein